MKQFTIDQLNDLLNRACDIITSLEGYAKESMLEYQGSYTQKEIDAFFDEIDHMNEDTGPEYDSAGFTEEDRIVNGQYMNMYKDTDPDLEAQDYNTFGEKKV
jgi:hypothetical protein